MFTLLFVRPTVIFAPEAARVISDAVLALVEARPVSLSMTDLSSVLALARSHLHKKMALRQIHDALDARVMHRLRQVECHSSCLASSPKMSSGTPSRQGLRTQSHRAAQLLSRPNQLRRHLRLYSQRRMLRRDQPQAPTMGRWPSRCWSKGRTPGLTSTMVMRSNKAGVATS